MKQNLWILNSSLLIILATTLLLNIFLKQEVPVLRKKAVTEDIIEKKIQPVINLEKIYKQDIFGTYSTEPTPDPKQKDWVNPIPEYTPPKITPPPAPYKQKFTEPLKIKISGIISSSKEEKNIAMISDETNKEKIYYTGDTIKDAQLIKITKNKVILLRTNGQQEIFLLRKEDKPGEIVPKKWKYVIEKKEENKFILNPKEFSKKIQSLGQLMEEFSLMPAYKNGNIIGMRISNTKENEINSTFGLNKNDIITSINDINTADIKNRIEIYDNLIQSKLNDTIEVALKRNEQEIKISYKLQKIKKPTKKMFIQPTTSTTEDQTPAPETKLKLSRNQKREKKIKDFEKLHRTPKQQDIISDIRNRILKNMKSRSQNRRVR